MANFAHGGEQEQEGESFGWPTQGVCVRLTELWIRTLPLGFDSLELLQIPALGGAYDFGSDGTASVGDIGVATA